MFNLNFIFLIKLICNQVINQTEKLISLSATHNIKLILLILKILI